MAGIAQKDQDTNQQHRLGVFLFDFTSFYSLKFKDLDLNLPLSRLRAQPVALS